MRTVSETSVDAALRAQLAHLERRLAGRGRHGDGRPLLGRASSSRACARAAAAAASGPSMYSTICASPPSAGTSVPTSRPSRSTVARSQSAITSASRWVMKRTERFCSFSSRATANTRSARSDGSAAVISSSRSSFGSRASARARSSMRSIGSGRSPVWSLKSSPMPMSSEPLPHDRDRGAA